MSFFDELNELPNVTKEMTYQHFLMQKIAKPAPFTRKEIESTVYDYYAFFHHPFQLTGKLLDIHQYCFQFLGAGLFLNISNITPQEFFEKYILKNKLHFAAYKLMCQLFYFKTYLCDINEMNNIYAYIGKYAKSCFKHSSDFTISPLVQQEHYDKLFLSYKFRTTLLIQTMIADYYREIASVGKDEVAAIENILVIFCQDLFEDVPFNYERYYLLNLFATRLQRLSRTDQKVINAICNFPVEFAPNRFYVATNFCLPHYHSEYEIPDEIEKWDVTSPEILIHYFLDTIDVYLNENNTNIKEIIKTIKNGVATHKNLFTSKKSQSFLEKEQYILRAFFSSLIYFVDGKITIEDFLAEEMEDFINDFYEAIPDNDIMKHLFKYYYELIMRLLAESK